MARLTSLVAFLAAASLSAASFVQRQVPANTTGVTTITSPQGAQIRYKQPGKQGVCETTEGVDDYAGYISLNEKTDMFFWFFEARENPREKPLTLWLNGGPGSDSLIGLFQEHGPCNVTEDLKTQLNPYSWNEHSNMLYLSQPVGVGFSYETTEVDDKGRYSLVDYERTNTTEAAAIGAWHILQAFLELSPQLDADIKNLTFNLWTESYGGHYGPGFYDYFYQQNEAIRNGTVKGVELRMDTLGIINGIIDDQIQAPYYPEFAVNNTYGIKAYNDTIYDRGAYDIRHPHDDPTPPKYFINYLNLSSTQAALGVNINYTAASSPSVFMGFETTGDFVYSFIDELSNILGYGVRVALLYGDADYICNWFGGEAVSLAVNHTNKAAFNAAWYTPFLVDGVEYGEVREYGNFSFTRMYESGHEVPYYQPKASLEYFKRVLDHKNIADGSQDVTADYGTNGTAHATHTESIVALLPTDSPTPSSYSSGGERRVQKMWRR
ncbi:hypothetical protein B5807_09919 [Epicoccum nigrum]|uniref:Carboxypeptidase n=1 Tax=Epicoccum nigrum TaxID=105696 RepID=A0A1Y2LTE6_EPING|nr:hypothetical protein B5807_09919 [Epicoccum nigrum]